MTLTFPQNFKLNSLAVCKRFLAVVDACSERVRSSACLMTLNVTLLLMPRRRQMNTSTQRTGASSLEKVNNLRVSLGRWQKGKIYIYMCVLLALRDNQAVRMAAVSIAVSK